MINYRSSAAFPTPPHQQAASDFAAQQSPYAGQNHQDVFQGLQQLRAVDMQRYAQRQQDEHEQAAGRAQREAALAGLTMLGNARNNQQNLANSRVQMLLGGLL